VVETVIEDDILGVVEIVIEDIVSVAVKKEVMTSECS